MLTVERGGPRPNLIRPRRVRTLAGRAFDLLAVASVLVLVGLGALNLYAVAGWSRVGHQLEVVAAGLVLLLVMRAMRVERLTVIGWACYALAVVLPIAVLVVGLEAQGARRWLDFGSFTVQPSELAKLGLLLVLADVLGSDRPPSRRFGLSVVLALVPISLTLVEPDLSTAMVLTSLTVAMLVLGRIPARLLVPLLATAATVAPLVVPLLRPYQVARLRGFVGGPALAGGGGPSWALAQAHIALASGGLTGLHRAPLHNLLAQYLPGRQTDLAFASLVEQFGLVAGAVAILATLVLVWRVALASRAPRTRRGSLIGAGLAALLGVQVVICLGGNLGVLPIAGVPFPLLSYGGAVSTVHLAALGLVLGARRDGARRRLWALPRWRNPGPRWVRTTALGTTGALVALSAYGWDLQAHGEALQRAGQAQMSRCIRIPASRGIITDRHGAPLAVNVAQDDVVAVPALLLPRPDAVARLAGLLQAPVSRLQQALAAATEISVKVGVVPVSAGDAIAAAGLTGVLVVLSPRRMYLHGPLLGPLVGYVGVATRKEARRWPNLPLGEMVGRAGIEQQYDPVLRGVDGEQCVYVDPQGRPVALGPRRDPVPGAGLRLSIDMGLQESLTAALTDALHGVGNEPRGDLGGAVAVDPVSGQVLAMASVPSYETNLYGPPVDAAALSAAASAKGHPTLEHATQVVAPPGSAFKVVVAAADTVHPVFAPDKVIPTGGSFTFGGHRFNNWRSFGAQNLVQAIAWSNDVYFYKLASTLGPDRIYDVGTALGVGQPTGIDLPGESSGFLGNPRSVHAIGGRWYPASSVILGIGQGYVTATPLQAARWTAAIATGRLVTPRVGLAFDAGDGNGNGTALPVPPPVDLPFAGSLGPVRQGMAQAVLVGTATVLRGLPVAVGAKTGTAQDPSSRNGATDSWLLAVAPLDHPAVVVTSFVRGGGHGARTSGHVVLEAMTYFFDHQADILATPPAAQAA